MRATWRAVERTVRGAKRDGRSMLRVGVWIWGAVLTCGLVFVWALNGWTDEPTQAGGHHHHPAATPPQKTMPQKTPVKSQPRLAIPPRWRFAIPAGDHHAGRQVYVDLECYKCHEVFGENFPAPKAERGNVGPALSGMGAMHPAEYFIETMIDPNASAAWRIKHHKDEDKGYLGVDGKSKMPSYNDSITVQQLIDLVAYLKSLTEGGHKH